MNRSNYAAERAELPPLPEVIYMNVEEITLHDVSPERQKAEYKQLLTEQEYEEDYCDPEAADHLGDDDEYDEPLSYSFTTNTYEDGSDPYELDIDSCHRAFDNNFAD